MNPIKQISEEFDTALELRDIPKIIEFFTEDCEIELLGVKLYRKNRAKKSIYLVICKCTRVTF